MLLLGTYVVIGNEHIGFVTIFYMMRKIPFFKTKTLLRLNSPAPLTDDWKVMDNSSVNFHDVFFFIFCYNLAKNEEKHIMEIYG